MVCSPFWKTILIFVHLFKKKKLRKAPAIEKSTEGSPGFRLLFQWVLVFSCMPWFSRFLPPFTLGNAVRIPLCHAIDSLLYPVTFIKALLLSSLRHAVSNKKKKSHLWPLGRKKKALEILVREDQHEDVIKKHALARGKTISTSNHCCCSMSREQPATECSSHSSVGSSR